MFNPPVILQTTEPEFQAAIRDEFINKSGISPDLFETIAEFAIDQEIENGEIVGEPIAEFLNWEIKESQLGFSSRQTTLALLLRNEDGTPFQAKLNYQSWDKSKERYGKPYKAPKRSNGEFSPAYLPPIGKNIRQSLGHPLDGSFWDSVEADPAIDVVIGEGCKKSLCALSHGITTIALYGCDAGSKKVDGQHVLIPDLARFCQPGRTFVIAFDKDENPETVERVNRAIGRLSWLLGKQAKNITVKVAQWSASQGKGLDDLVVNCGPDGLRKAIADAKIPPRESYWGCLDSHNYQLGRWDEKEVQVGKPDQQKLSERVAWDPNVEFLEEFESQNKHGKIVQIQEYRVFVALCDFDFVVSKRIEDGDGGGLELEVSWMERSTLRTRKGFIKSSETLTVKDFRLAVNRITRTHLTTKLKPNDLDDLLKNRKYQYSKQGGKSDRLADRVGQQADGTWVFEGAQFKADGSPATEKETQWMFNRELCDTLNIPSPTIAPHNPDALKNLVTALQAFFHPGTMPYLYLMLGFQTMGFHRQAVMEETGEMASLIVYGEKGGGKSTGHKAAGSLCGLHGFTPSQVTEPMIFNYAAHLGSLPIQWDDPIRQGDYAKADEKIVASALWKFFTGLGRENMLHVQKPQTNLCVSSNRTLGVDTAATATRIISFIFPKLDVNRSKGHLLNPAFKQASGAFQDLLSIPYDRIGIEERGNQLLEHLSEADSRNANSLATLAYFTQKFCDLAGVEFDALTFIKTDICPQTNEQGSGKDSLTDFLEKLLTLKSEGTAGDWNLGESSDRDGSKYLAVHLPGIWDAFEARFKPNYGLSLIAKLAEDAGGIKNAKRYFVSSRDNAQAYQRALTQWVMGIAGSEQPQELKRDRAAKALLIPRSVAEKAGFFPTPEGQDEPTADPVVVPTATPEPTPEPIAATPQTQAPTTQAKPKRSITPTHRNSDGEEGVITREYGLEGDEFVVFRTIEGKNRPAIKKASLTLIGGKTNVAI